jgi:hypothetical protein
MDAFGAKPLRQPEFDNASERLAAGGRPGGRVSGTFWLGSVLGSVNSFL